MAENTLADALADLVDLAHDLGRQQVAGQVADAGEQAKRVAAVDGIIGGVGVEVQAAREAEWVRRKIAASCGVIGAPAVLVQAGFLVVVLAGQAERLAQMVLGLPHTG